MTPEKDQVGARNPVRLGIRRAQFYFSIDYFRYISDKEKKGTYSSEIAALDFDVSEEEDFCCCVQAQRKCGEKLSIS